MSEQQDIAIYDQLSFMKRRYRSRVRYARGLISAVPLADVVLVILMFLILNSWHVMKPAVYVNLPEAPFTAGVRPGAMVVTISRGGLVFFDDERITLNGLREGFMRAARERPDAAVIIEADERVAHGAIIRIYRMAMEAGVEEVAIATRVEKDIAAPGEPGPEAEERAP